MNNQILNEDPAALAAEHRRGNPLIYLKLKTLIVLLGLIGAGFVDFLSVTFVMRERYTDAMGNFAGNTLELIAVSLMTLLAYWMMGLLWKANQRYAAGGLYIIILGLLMLCLWPSETARIQEIWASFTPHANSAFATQQDSADAATQAPFWFMAGCNMLLAFCFTFAGLTFIYCKFKLDELIHPWKNHMTQREIENSKSQLQVLEKTVKQHASFSQWLNEPATRERIIAQAEYQALSSVRDKVNKKKAAAEAVSSDVTASAQQKRDAQETIARADRFSAALKFGGNGTHTYVMVLLVALLLASRNTNAQTTAELCHSAPVFQLIADVSGSSPARDPGFVKEAMSLIETRLRQMAPCTTVLLVSAGDANVMPEIMRSRIQLRTTREGATVNDIAVSMRQWLNGLPQRITAHPQARSELIGAFYDASKNLNPNAHTPNVVIMLSDLVEHSPLADCEGRAVCRLPDPKFALPNTEVTVYGVGLGLPSNRAMSVQAAWTNFFAKAGSQQVDLRRTF